MEEDKFARATVMPHVQANPVQRPGNKLLRRSRVGGPTEPGDRRMYLHSGMLGKLLEIARSSPTSQVQLNSIGIVVELYEDPNGHTYEVWSFESHPPRPEQLPSSIANLVPPGGF